MVTKITDMSYQPYLDAYTIFRVRLNSTGETDRLQEEYELVEKYRDTLRQAKGNDSTDKLWKKFKLC